MYATGHSVQGFLFSHKIMCKHITDRLLKWVEFCSHDASDNLESEVLIFMGDHVAEADKLLPRIGCLRLESFFINGSNSGKVCSDLL